MTANQIMEEVRSFVPSHNGDILRDDGDDRLHKEDIITFTKKTTTGMTTNKVTIASSWLSSDILILKQYPSLDLRVPERQFRQQ